MDDPALIKFMTDVSTHMGVQTQFQANIKDWMERLDAKVDDIPNHCFTGQQNRQRIERLENLRYDMPEPMTTRRRDKRVITVGIPVTVLGGSGVLGAIIWIITKIASGG